MTFFANRDINRLAVHTALVTFAWSLSGVFVTVFLLRAGLAPAYIFLAAATILALRFGLRPLVVLAVSAFGLRRALMLGTTLSALQYPVLALVHGVGPALAAYCTVAALAQVFYWTSYHSYFSILGDIDRRGHQVGAREALGAIASVFAPALGGILLAQAGPWPAFGASFVIELAAIAPLLRIAEPKVADPAPRAGYAAARMGIRLFFTDGWIYSSSVAAWNIVMFRALSARYDNFGGALAVAALAGALSGMLLGRFIDLGHARRTVWINAVILAGGLILKSVCGSNALVVIAVATGTTLLGGLYVPALMTAVYNQAKAAPCPFRFHFITEGSWDAGGIAASLIAAAFCAASLPIEAVILLALPMVAVQALLLDTSYAQARAGATASAAA